MYRCSVCSKFGKGVWVSFRNFDVIKTQKTQFKTHGPEIKLNAAWKLMTSHDRNNDFWNKNVEEVVFRNASKKTEFLKKKRDLVRSVMFLAKEEISIRKYRSLLKYASEFDGSSVEVGSHSSINAGWGFLEYVSDNILKRDSKIIRDAPMQSIIIDSTNDGDDWVDVLAR